MTETLLNGILKTRHMGCYGEFDIEDPCCKTLCALRIRCSITRDHDARMEILEELVSAEEMPDTVQ